MKLGIDIRWLHEAFINAGVSDRAGSELLVPPVSAEPKGSLGGVGRYLYELLPRLSQCLSDASVVLFFLEGSPPPVELGHLWPNAIPATLPSLWRPKGAAWGPLWRTFQSYHETRSFNSVRSLDLDLFFSPHQLMVPGERWARMRIVTCHDLAYLQHPELFFGGARIPTSYRDLYQRLSQCERIIAVSAATAEAARKHLSIPDHRLYITPEGISETVLSQGEPFNPGWPYLLHVGGAGPTKNMRTVLEGWSLASDRRPGLHLILAGTHRSAIVSLLESRALLDHEGLHCVTPLDDRQLASLYRSAELLLMPSIIEGFGLPVLEAMACGCPVITSRSSPMEEIASEAAVLIDHRSPEQLAYAISSVLSDIEKRKTMAELGKSIALQYSWERTAELTAKAMRDAASGEPESCCPI